MQIASQDMFRLWSIKEMKSIEYIMIECVKYTSVVGKDLVPLITCIKHRLEALDYVYITSPGYKDKLIVQNQRLLVFY